MKQQRQAQRSEARSITKILQTGLLGRICVISVEEITDCPKSVSCSVGDFWTGAGVSGRGVECDSPQWQFDPHPQAIDSPI